MLILAATGVSMMLNMASGSWLTISDDVMGGESNGEVVTIREGVRFQGTLSRENNGGFSSVRRLFLNSEAGIPEGLRLSVRGDGRRYQLRLRQDYAFDGISWRAEFETSKDWQELEFSFKDFEAVYRGRLVAGKGHPQPDQIKQIGFLVAEGEAGPFQLDIKRLEVISGAFQAQQ